MSDQLNARNIQTLAQGMRDLEARLSDMNQVVNDLRGQNAGMAQRLVVLEQQSAIVRIAAMGRGPTA